MNFANVQEQEFIPLYRREKITDNLHEACGFRTDYQFITKNQMKTIQKKAKTGNKLPRSVELIETSASSVFIRFAAILIISN